MTGQPIEEKKTVNGDYGRAIVDDKDKNQCRRKERVLHVE